MSKSITGDMLSKEIIKVLEGYVDDIEEDVEETVDIVTKKAKQELVQKSPKSGIARNTKYYKGWAIKTGGRTRKKHYYGKTIWNKTNYQLTHILEFGHSKSDGTDWVDAKPHIREVEEEYSIQFADLLEKKIRRN